LHWVDLYELLEKLQQNRQLPAILVGLAAGSLFGLMAAHLFWKGRLVGLIAELRAQIVQITARWEGAVADSISQKNLVEDGNLVRRTLEDNSNRLKGQLEHQRQVIEGLTTKCEQHKNESHDLEGELDDLKDDLEIERKGHQETASLAAKYSEQLDGVMNSDGKIWLKPTKNVPTFMPLHKRRTAIISLANLKGGVGKTTITANLGAALAAQGLRVLLIDLDHQSSLTNRCVTTEEQTELKRSGRFNDELFEKGGDLTALNACVTRLQTPTGSGQLYLAPVREQFDELETRLMTRWHSGLTPEDVRFRLRQALHSSRLRNHYDVVLIDCPPRLTTGSVNALAASDYVLIPVLLEDASAEGVPRILAWLKKFQTTSCGEFNVLGVVGNKAYNRAKLIAREQVVWDALKKSSQQAWGEPVHHFDEVIRDHPSVEGKFAALDPRHQPRYEELVTQIRRAIPHANLQPAAVSPVDVATFDVVGS